MYYNIKIKSDGSEFTLESNDKDVTQREMDIYFASIFDVSEEFRASIKTIEHIDKSVKSINDFDVFAQKQQVQTEQAPVVQTPQSYTEPFAMDTKDKNEEPIAVPEAVKSEITLESVLPKENDTKINNEINISSIPEKNTEIHISQTSVPPSTTPVSQELKISNTVIKQESPMVEIKDTIETESIDELISLAQDKVNDVNIISSAVPSEDNITNNPDESTNSIGAVKEFYNPENSLKEKEKYESFQKENIDNIFKSFNEDYDETLGIVPKDESDSINEESNVQNNPEEKIETESFTPQPSSELPFEPITLEPFVQNTQTQQTNYETAQIYPTVPEASSEPENIFRTTTIPESAEDFQKYLSNYKYSTIEDEFLICAYYMRNVLKEDLFSLKTVNSKIFNATGKIADLSVVDELVTKEYIKTIEIDGLKKYAITARGEGYFLSRFKG